MKLYFIHDSSYNKDRKFGSTSYLAITNSQQEADAFVAANKEATGYVQRDAPTSRRR